MLYCYWNKTKYLNLSTHSHTHKHVVVSRIEKGYFLIQQAGNRKCAYKHATNHKTKSVVDKIQQKNEHKRKSIKFA